MYASSDRSDLCQNTEMPVHQRVDASGAVSFKMDTASGITRLDRLYQRGSAKIRFPKNHRTSADAVLINTAGGMTGGDRLDWNIQAGPKSQVVVTTQACERAYRSSGGVAHIHTNLQVGKNATIHWLPQETILFEASALHRHLEVELADGACLIAMEATLLGRHAMGEILKQCEFVDRWRVRRNGKLIFADDINLRGDMTKTASSI